MDSFQRFLKNLPKMQLEEQVQEFRHEALRSVHMAIGCATLLQNEIEGSSQLSDEVQEWSHKLLHYLDEMRQLLNVLAQPPDNGTSE
ncbi:MAG: hypothetical protein CL608_31760 [Anaerolineaceae bacterium]|nr:hypothetical protein [Anaerolineaceae bacterium]